LLPLALLATNLPAAAAGVPKPQVINDAGEQCVAPPEVMRRDHMDMLKHTRDKTMRQGIRGEKASLKGCINCHASRTTGSVIGSPQAFCEGCHSYAAVKLDCFECHQPKAGAQKMATGVKP
jgi:hypothetical protein